MDKADRFLELLEANRDRLLNELAHITYNKDDALDLFQDTVVLGFQHFGELRDEKAFSKWIRACARSAVSAKYRKMMSREIPVDTTAPGFDETTILTFNDDEQQDALDALIRKLEIDEIRDFTANLGFTARVFLHMRYELGMSMKEIAEDLGTTPEYLAVLHHRIKKKLRNRKRATDES